MDNKEINKEYSNGELTIIWKPKTCIHAGECVKRLPEVYNPKARPWIKIENATTEELKEQINSCPSGALTYKMNTTEDKEENQEETQVNVLKNGPLMVQGLLKVTKANGEFELKKNKTAFCRCGVSSNKPYCDGSHLKSGFKG